MTTTTPRVTRYHRSTTRTQEWRLRAAIEDAPELSTGDGRTFAPRALYVNWCSLNGEPAYLTSVRATHIGDGIDATASGVHLADIPWIAEIIAAHAPWEATP